MNQSRIESNLQPVAFLQSHYVQTVIKIYIFKGTDNYFFRTIPKEYSMSSRCFGEAEDAVWLTSVRVMSARRASRASSTAECRCLVDISYLYQYNVSVVALSKYYISLYMLRTAAAFASLQGTLIFITFVFVTNSPYVYINFCYLFIICIL